MLKSRVVLFALAVTTSIAVRAEPFVLAAGRSVTIMDASDNWVRVVITAPADAPLDLTALFSSLGPKEGVQALATRSQLPQADAIVRNDDGSLSLTSVAAEIPSDARSIEGGFFTLVKGGYTYSEEEPGDRIQADGVTSGYRLVGRHDHGPLPGSAIGGLPKAQAPDVAPAIPGR
jgi:hypothetical protein